MDRRFWFDGTAGMRLSRDDDAAVREMWTTMNGWLAEAVTGMEIDGITDGRGVVARLDRLFVRRRDRIEGRAAAILERELGGDVWLASIAIWNALCAALLREHLPDALRADLESAWRQVRSHGVLEAGGDEDPRDMLSGVGDGHPPA